jgi:hexokinase
MADVPKDLLQEIKRLEEMFIVPAGKLKEITTHFVSELEKGNNVLSELSPHQCHFLRVNPLAVMYISGHSVFLVATCIWAIT